MSDFSSGQRLDALKRYFGHGAFRGAQERAVESILGGRDTLCVMPTGAGKSVCFQLPAVLLDGITFVISPLISLMKDQIDSLSQNGIPCACINSSLSLSEIKNVLSNTAKGRYKLIYIAPERLDNEWFLSFAKSLKISMIVVDEAHCVSQWGQDFRVSYTKISDFVDSIMLAGIPARPFVCAFTATATPRVREDIVKMLKLQDPEIIVSGFDRENLNFEVRRPAKKFEELSSFLRELRSQEQSSQERSSQERSSKSGIIYCLTRKTVDELSEKLKSLGFSVAPYHAGLSAKDRHKNQEDFIFDRVHIIVATNAFGMGVNKSNVSFVLHYNMPKDIESYYQEAGRAGRDGSPADAVILYSGQDIRTNLFLINESKDKQYSSPEEEMYLKSLERKRLKEMDLYCNTHECLRRYILKYFGEEIKNPQSGCKNCGNCNCKSDIKDITVLSQKILSCVFRMRENFGKNTVIDVLKGSKNARVQRFMLDKLSTYGICKEHRTEIQDAITFLLVNGFLDMTNGEFPVLKLGGRANEILKDKIKVEMKLSANKQKESQVADERAAKLAADKLLKAPAGTISTIDQKLFANLKSLRAKLANAQNLPAYIIFHDSALIDMCAKLPKTKEDFAMISGVGAQKLERYGDIFIKEISNYLSAAQS
ncbi:MAG: DNA helicase RecQ [Endomicrobia bacterium]|nr:DNA helicase RecQ [Endomicrobiia bacterium]